MSRYLAIVPARGGSRRLPRKNLVEIAGRSLLERAARAAFGARLVSAAIVSTDDPEIAARAVGLGLANPGMRPAALAGDASPTIDALRHALFAHEAQGAVVDAVVVLQPTSPFRTARHVDEAIALHRDAGADTVVAVRAVHDHPYWCWRRERDAIVPWFGEREVSMDRAALPEAFAENGAIYVVRRDLVAAGRLYGARVLPYRMSEADSVDIDTPLDLAWARHLVAAGLAEAAS